MAVIRYSYKAYCSNWIIYVINTVSLFSVCVCVGGGGDDNALLVSSRINCIVERCLINVAYLTACAFIRS